ncbi:MAG: hypothetical protein WBN89_04435 [Prochlorococcaceae cyanobacterium]
MNPAAEDDSSGQSETVTGRPAMSPLRSQGQALLFSTCAAGLSCLALLAAPLAPVTAQSSGAVMPAAPTEKNSPYAASQDETTTPMQGMTSETLERMEGTKAKGSTKDSPFAGAKDSNQQVHQGLAVDRRRGWLLLVPVGLAALSYGALRSQERDHS